MGTKIHLARTSGERLGKVISDLARRGFAPSQPLKSSEVASQPLTFQPVPRSFLPLQSPAIH